MTGEPGAADPSVGRATPGVGRAALAYTGLRLGVFMAVLALACAIVLPLTSGPLATRVLSCALIAAIVSIPVSLLAGRRLRADLTAALLDQRAQREERDRAYDERVRAGRRGRGA